MRLPKFDLVFPTSLCEASQCLQAKGNRARLLAGGTDLLVSMKQWTTTPEVVINLKSIPGLSGIRMSPGGGMNIGPLTKLRDVAASTLVRQHYPELARAASVVASAQIRNVGTIGGNICLAPKCYFVDQSISWWGCSQECRKRDGNTCYIIPGSTSNCFALMSGDTVPALIAYKAKIQLTGPDRERVFALEDFYTGNGLQHLALNAGEILSDIQLPAPGGKVAFLKYATRNTIDFATVSVAVGWRPSPPEARIVLGAVASGPVRAQAAEAVLAQNPRAEVAEEVGRVAAEKLKIVSWVRGPLSYKKHLVQVLVRDAVRQLQAQATA